MECCICFEEPEKNRCTLDCGNIFCRECIHEWIRHIITCPLCRRPIRFEVIFDHYLTTGLNYIQFGGRKYVFIWEDILLDDGEFVQMILEANSLERNKNVSHPLCILSK